MKVAIILLLAILAVFSDEVSTETFPLGGGLQNQSPAPKGVDPFSGNRIGQITPGLFDQSANQYGKSGMERHFPVGGNSGPFFQDMSYAGRKPGFNDNFSEKLSFSETMKIPVMSPGSDTLIFFNLNQLPRQPNSLEDLQIMLQERGLRIADGFQLNTPGIQMPQPGMSGYKPNLGGEINRKGQQPGMFHTQGNGYAFESGQNNGGLGMSGMGGMGMGNTGSFSDSIKFGDASTPGSLAWLTMQLAAVNTKVMETMRRQGKSDMQIKEEFELLATDLKKVWSMDISQLPHGKTRPGLSADIITQFVQKNNLHETQGDMNNIMKKTTDVFVTNYPHFAGAQKQWNSMVNEKGVSGAIDMISVNSNLAFGDGYGIIGEAWVKLKSLIVEWFNRMGLNNFAEMVAVIELPKLGARRFFEMEWVKAAMVGLLKLAANMLAIPFSLLMEESLGGVMSGHMKPALGNMMGGGMGGMIGGGSGGGMGNMMGGGLGGLGAGLGNMLGGGLEGGSGAGFRGESGAGFRRGSGNMVGGAWERGLGTGWGRGSGGGSGTGWGRESGGGSGGTWRGGSAGGWVI